MKSREYESKLKILRNDLNRTEDELNHSQNLSQRVKDECDSSKNKVCIERYMKVKNFFTKNFFNCRDGCYDNLPARPNIKTRTYFGS